MMKLRIGTKPKDYVPLTEEIHKKFLYRIALTVKKYSIPKCLCINFDETGVYLTSRGNRTFHRVGDKQVPIYGLNDKRQVTVGLAVTVDGRKLSGQVIFKGKTQRALPKINTDWLMCYSPNHWQKVDTTKQYLINVIFPYCKKTIQEIGGIWNQKSLLIWDIWCSHMNEEVIQLCEQNNVKMIIVPPNQTKDLQVLDVNLFSKKIFILSK